MMRRSKEDRIITVRSLNELVYCPRLYHLMYVQGLFEESADTIEGSGQHNRRRAGGAKLAENERSVVPWSNRAVESLTLSDDTIGILGRFDAVVEESAQTIPVEYKHGAGPDARRLFRIGPFDVDGGAWPNDQIQVAAQMALLRGNGYVCEKARLFYRKTAQTVVVPWSQTLGDALQWAVAEARRLTAAAMPEPLCDSPKCVRCSLNHICLPDETLMLKERLDEPRKLHPGRDEAGVLYLTVPGSRLSKRGENARIHVPGGSTDSIPLKEIAHVCLFGNCQVSTQMVAELTSRGATITYLSGGGWLRAVTSAPLAKNVALRREQFLKFSQPSTCLRLARSLVAAKIANARTLLRRNRTGDLRGPLAAMKRFERRAGGSRSIDELRGIEGAAGRLYWREFAGLLRPLKGGVAMSGRTRRPPKDPVNAMLSYGYTLLLRDFFVASMGVGFDPLYGFYHTIEPGRPALALDLMEPFRPVIVDSAVLRAVNEGLLGEDDFVSMPGCCVLKRSPKRKWIAAYERRVDELVTHPAFGYRLSYRRVLSLEARLLGRFLEGDIDDYKPLRTR